MLLSILVAASLNTCEVTPLVPFELSHNDQLGKAVAIDGAVAVVGLNRDDPDDDLPGAAQVFRRTAGAWIVEALLEPPDGTNLDLFGRAVAVSGQRIAVGAYGDDDAGAFAGSVSLFTYDGTAWSFEAQLFAPDASPGDRFGLDVALDGDTLVVGAPFDDDDGLSSGSAWVFERGDDDAWSPAVKLTAPVPRPHDLFGMTVALDGGVIAIGAPLDDTAGSDAGAVHVFRDLDFEQTVPGLHAFDHFAIDVDVSGDRIAVGAHLGDAALVSSGVAYVLHFDGVQWVVEAEVAASTPTAFAQFGISVGLDADDLVVGAHGDAALGGNAGGAHLFRRGVEGWRHTAYLLAPDGTTRDRFGRAVAVSDGQALIGAFLHDGCPDLFEIQCGAAYTTSTLCAVGDLDGDDDLDFDDLLLLLAAWGPCAEPCAADLDGDGGVGLGDLLILLANWS